MEFETLAVHAGRQVDQATGGVTPPIHLSTTFERSEDGTYPRGYIYSRSGNPNRSSLEQCLAALEDGQSAAAFSSGSAASMAVFQALSGFWFSLTRMLPSDKPLLHSSCPQASMVSTFRRPGLWCRDMPIASPFTMYGFLAPVSLEMRAKDGPS